MSGAGDEHHSRGGNGNGNVDVDGLRSLRDGKAVERTKTACRRPPVAIPGYVVAPSEGDVMCVRGQGDDRHGDDAAYEDGHSQAIRQDTPGASSGLRRVSHYPRPVPWTCIA